jgi:hypothetical protein
LASGFCSLPESSGDDLLVEIQDSKGATHGRLVVHIATISDDPNDRVRWYGFYNEREHECVGKVQLFLNYTTTSGEIGSAKVCAILVGVETTCMLLVYIYLCQGCPFVLG